MFSLFRRGIRRPRIEPVQSPSPSPDPHSGIWLPQTASSLLATERRRRLLEHIWQRTSLSRAQFQHLYLAPIERYAELVQLFPASEGHHHAFPGGMLDHGLEIVAYALKLRQSHLLPTGATPEAQAAQAEAWTAGVAYAALLHDVGKVAVDLEVEQDEGIVWHPWHGPLQRPYRFRHRKGREYRLHGAAAGLLYVRVLDRDILDWLSGFPDLWSALLFVLAGQHEHAGVLGELVVQADQASVANALGGDPARALAAPRHALQRKLLDGLRYLLREQLKLNQPQASDGWLTQDTLWLVSKTVSDKLRAHLLSQGIDGIPSSNTAVFNVLQEHGVLLPTPDGKAIWRARVTSGTGWTNTFTFLRLSPALIWEPDDRPAAFKGQIDVVPDEETAHPTTPTPTPQGRADRAELDGAGPVSASASREDGVEALPTLLDTPLPASIASPYGDAISEREQSLVENVAASDAQLPGTQEGMATEASAPSGQDFLRWLRDGIQQHRLIINDAKALVHTVADTAYLVSPGVFQRYAQEHPDVGALAKRDKVADWQWVQKQFEKLHLHRKQGNGLNIWTCEVIGPRKARRLHGYLLHTHLSILPKSWPDNPYLKLKEPTANVRTNAMAHHSNDN
ncbi:MobH family relaxase [Xanthomonas oryzae]|uniref:MobH family relaxase n=1 Tax=Xanthomonas oryzae TaxID=347 RepID=UPI0010337446|nr:MobH family relaxase [Xanthomonas oryzae]QBG94617.1 relaxase [Xanthomonas oryzae]QBH01341.1 relaxase [Xanthomonas oryzae]